MRSFASLAVAGITHALLVLVGALSLSPPSAGALARDTALELADDLDPRALTVFDAPQLPGDDAEQSARSVPVHTPGPRAVAHRLGGAPVLSGQELIRANSALTPASFREHEVATATRGPRLIPALNPCGSFFPSQAACDLGLVTLELQVTPSGAAAAPRVLAESPTGQGFAEAARRCISRLQFLPALDAASQPIAAASVVRLRFSR